MMFYRNYILHQNNNLLMENTLLLLRSTLSFISLSIFVFIGNITFASNIDSLLNEIQIHQSSQDPLILSKLNDKVGLVLYQQGKLDSALVYFEKAKGYVANCTDPQLASSIDFHNGVVNSQLNNHLKALTFFEDYVKTSKEQGETKKYVKGTVKIATTHTSLGDYDKSYQILLNLLNDIDQQEHPLQVGYISYELGSTFFYQENYQEALEYYRKAKKIFEENEDSTALYNSLGGLGSVYNNLKSYDEALIYHKKALKLSKELDYDYGIAIATYNVANSYFALEDYTQAHTYFIKAKDLMAQNNDNVGLCYAIAGLGTLYAKQDEPEKASYYLEKAIGMTQENGGRSHLQKIYQQAADAYFDAGDTEKAYHFLSKHVEIKEELINDETTKSMANIKTSYEIQKAEKDAKIVLLKKDAQINQLYLYGGLGMLIFSLLISSLLFSRYRFQTKTNNLLEQKNQEIEQQNRRLVDSNKALEQFAYIASHDLKEPLRTISSYSSLLQRRYIGDLDENAQDYFSYIVNSVKRMYRLLDDIMSYSKISQEDTPNELVKTQAVVDSVLLSLQPEIENSKANIDVKNKLPDIMAQETQMVQLFQNLISNAIKFRKADQNPHIQISSTTNLEQTDYVFKVQDNGIGIPKQYQEKIFEAFKRLNNKNEYEGSGVGLAICSKIVDRLGGKIWVDSAEGKGTTFQFTIPIANIPDNTESTEANTEAHNPNPIANNTKKELTIAPPKSPKAIEKENVAISNS